MRDWHVCGVVTILVIMKAISGKRSGGAVGGIGAVTMVNTFTMGSRGSLPIVIVTDGRHKVDVNLNYHGVPVACRVYSTDNWGEGGYTNHGEDHNNIHVNE